ncbi:MAG: helix-turn-helix domain-containing protein [Anaerolineaceae bacterium]|nr:helix-turn-helix domain-containing protein [Anaerolineaceae bacterium]
MKKTDLILHPIRLQILSILAGHQYSTKEIAHKLHNIPVSTIYRQMRVLADNDLIEVVDSRSVKGTLENIYSVTQPPHLSEEDMKHVNKDQHFQYFLQYILSILDGFQRYLDQPEEINLAKDFVGYNETYFYVNHEEMLAFGKAFGEIVKPLAENKPGNEHRLHKFAFITHPVSKESNNDE